MNHPIPIGNKLSPLEVIPPGDTITINFTQDLDLMVSQSPMFPPAFLPYIPSGQYLKGARIGPFTAQAVKATVTLDFMLLDTGDTGSVVIKVE